MSELGEEIVVDLPYLEALRAAVCDAAPPRENSPHASIELNNTFVGSYSTFSCGHYYFWRDCLAWFHPIEDKDREICPGCLPQSVRQGRVVIDRAELEQAIAAIKRFEAHFEAQRIAAEGEQHG